MKKETMVKALFITSVALAILVGAVSAQVQPRSPGIVVTVTPINDVVQPGETATYQVSVESVALETEHVVLSIDPERPGWGYTFDPVDFDIGPGATMTSELSITVPTGAELGDYYHDVIGTAYIDGIPIPVETSIYTNVKTTAIPEFPTIAIPVAAIIGLFLLISRRKKE